MVKLGVNDIGRGIFKEREEGGRREREVIGIPPFPFYLQFYMRSMNECMCL